MSYEAINLSKKFTLFDEQWQPKVIAEMNDYQFKVVKLQGDFIWHDHKNTDETFIVLESVRKVHAGLQSFLSMRRIEARRKKASALRLRFSQSLANLRQRLSQAMLRSTIQRLGKTTNTLTRSERLTISTLRFGSTCASPAANFGP
jgi:hypothetical protein